MEVNIMLCTECNKSELVERLENIRYEESGIPNVVLEAIKVRQCPTCGNRLVSIPRITELHRCIAVHLVKKPSRLAPAEITFLRKSLGWSKSDFAKKMHVKPEQIYRWESDKSPKAMMIQSELLLRAFVAIGKKIEHYEDQVDHFATIDIPEASPFAMIFNNGWQEHQLASA